MFEYMFARHRADYVKIAFRHWTTPRHVWALAHGKHAKGHKDTEILHDLLDMGIIHRHNHTHDSEE